mmetsp:Transcript_26535/g.85389  ORF Transcript_26535/g.85389 Transcript_26535/m.85389 type:complete len:208 (+) Transcript_26535:1938-2561(+)
MAHLRRHILHHAGQPHGVRRLERWRLLACERAGHKLIPLLVLGLEESRALERLRHGRRGVLHRRRRQLVSVSRLRKDGQRLPHELLGLPARAGVRRQRALRLRLPARCPLRARLLHLRPLAGLHQRARLRARERRPRLQARHSRLLLPLVPVHEALAHQVDAHLARQAHHALRRACHHLLHGRAADRARHALVLLLLSQQWGHGGAS